MILLDTDIMIDILRDYPPAVQWMQSLGDEAIVLPSYRKGRAMVSIIQR